MTKHKRILITGGAGFIGSHLCEALVRNGDQVTLLDDLSTGRWSNVERFSGHAKFRALIASARDRALVEKEVAEHDVVYHLASAVGVKLVVERPVHTVETIFHTTDIVLGACARYRKSFVLTSTSEVYGKSDAVPFREDADVVMGPSEKRRWAYACAKALDEFLTLAHYWESRLPVFIVRLFNTVGPRQTGQYGMVLPTFVRQALAAEPITVYGDGRQRRCFCSVHDVVEGLIRLPTVSDAIGKVVNLGSQEEVSMMELANRVRGICDSPSEIRLVPYEEAYGAGFDDMPRRVPDLTRAQQYLGWNPKHSLTEIIQSVIEYLRSSGSASAMASHERWSVARCPGSPPVSLGGCRAGSVPPL